MREGTESWVKKAKGDVESAKLLNDSAQYDNCCFHAHQASEKYFKAILAELGVIIPRTHNLESLIEFISENGLEIAEAIRYSASEINRFATLTRYPGYDATLEDATRALRHAMVIEMFVLGYLRTDLHI